MTKGKATQLKMDKYLDKHPFNEDTHIENIPLQRFYTSLILSETQIINKLLITVPKCKQPLCSSRAKLMKCGIFTIQDTPQQ